MDWLQQPVAACGLDIGLQRKFSSVDRESNRAVMVQLVRVGNGAVHALFCARRLCAQGACAVHTAAPHARPPGDQARSAMHTDRLPETRRQNHVRIETIGLVVLVGLFCMAVEFQDFHCARYNWQCDVQHTTCYNLQFGVLLPTACDFNFIF